MPPWTTSKLQHSEVPAIRSFRICLDRPQRPTTILGIIRRVAAEQGELRARPRDADQASDAISPPDERLRLSVGPLRPTITAGA